jgi:hypothetical protein
MSSAVSGIGGLAPQQVTGNVQILNGRDSTFNEESRHMWSMVSAWNAQDQPIFSGTSALDMGEASQNERYSLL